MKFLLALLLQVTTFTIYAQVEFLTNDNLNGMTYKSCEENHSRILNLHLKQTRYQLSKTLFEIESEMEENNDKLRLNRYYSLLSELLLKEIMIEELIKQLHQFDWNKYSSRDIKTYNTPVFNLNHVPIQFDERIKASLDRAASFQYQISTCAMEGIKGKVLLNFLNQSGLKIAKKLGMTIVAQVAVKSIAATTIKNAYLQFGAEAMKGVARGAALTILTMPLKGNRLPPESEWLNLLEENPSLIINPDWMKEADSVDHPWKTHCNTIHRKPQRMQKMVDAFLKKDSLEYYSKLQKIKDSSLLRKELNAKKELNSILAKPKTDNLILKKQRAEKSL